MACIVSGNEIILTGTVGGGGFWWDEDCFSHADVITALAQVGRDADITVRVNSGGGVATEGEAIRAAFAQHKGKVCMVVEGWAASAASLLIMGGDTITMNGGALLMIHDPSSGVWGNADCHRKCAADLDAMANAYAQVYADRTGKTVEEMRAVMRAETWLGPADAVAQGFADAAAEASNDNTETEPVAFSGISAYMRAPERIVALAKANGWAPIRANPPGLSAAATATAPQKEPTMSEIQKPKADGIPAPADTETKADPTAIAEACAAANMPATMAAALMRQGATMAQVNDHIATAARICDVATMAGLPTMGPKLVAMGASLDQARDAIQEVRVLKDEGIITDPVYRGNDDAQPKGAAMINHKAIYARMNGIKE